MDFPTDFDWGFFLFLLLYPVFFLSVKFFFFIFLYDPCKEVDFGGRCGWWERGEGEVGVGWEECV